MSYSKLAFEYMAMGMSECEAVARVRAEREAAEYLEYGCECGDCEEEPNVSAEQRRIEAVADGYGPVDA